MSASFDALVVRRPGLQTTVQDLGRAGYARYGVPLSGALDPLALRLGNLLLDNPEGAAALELTLVGPELEALAALTCACVGADMNLRINGESMAPGRAFEVEQGAVLEFGAAGAGARAYLCVRGGLDVPPVMGSRSTGVTAHIGGVEGRPLLGGDVLRVGRTEPAPDAVSGRRLEPRWVRYYPHHWLLRVTEGAEAPSMSEAVRRLLDSTWRVTDRSNRTGVRLEGPALRADQSGFETEGVPLGAVQVPPDGAPIILLADRQVTGGYPNPAVLVTVDLPLAGQLRPRDTLSFDLISMSDAVQLLREREALIAEGVFERTRTGRTKPVSELVQTLENSRVQEFHLSGGDISFHWRRDKPGQ